MRFTGLGLVLALVLSSSAARAGDKPAERAEEHPLTAVIDKLVSNSALTGTRTGVLVSSLDTGQVIYAHNADELFNPASNVKLFTAAAALARLGPEFRFDTEFCIDESAPASSVRALYVRGKGDPSMITERLWAIAGELAHQGLRSAQELVVDDSFFDGERTGPGYDQERGDRAYLAPASGLSLNFNDIAIHVAPGNREGEKGRIELEPASEFFTIENRTVTVKAKALRRVTPSSTFANGRQRITVEGRLPLGSRDQIFYRKIDDPPSYFGYTLKRLLELRGVKVGKVRRGKVPAQARLLFVAQSDSLGEITRRLLKTSNNFVAEQLLKRMGAEAFGPPGTWPKGVEAVEEFLAEAGLPRGSYLMKNGSGLNDTNRFSARQIVTLLKEMWRRFPLMAEFVGSLPVAGRDGTIKWRMEGTDAVGRLRAKTGTLENITSLSGYVETRGHERLAFAIMVNDYSGRSTPYLRAIDAIGSALAANGGPPAPAETPAPKPEAELESYVASYYQLAKAADRRNLPFLRTALRTERNAVLQLAAAEAIYLSDPDDKLAQRTFLDSITNGEALARLQTLTARQRLPPPIIGSLGSLAAEGNPEAMARLVDLAPSAMANGTAAMAGDFATTWLEVTRAAPEEALTALRSAPAPTVDRTLDALVAGLAQQREAQHPFLDTIRRLGTGGSGALSEFARTLLSRYEERLRAAKTEVPAHPAALPAQPVPESQRKERWGG